MGTGGFVAANNNSDVDQDSAPISISDPVMPEKNVTETSQPAALNTPFNGKSAKVVAPLPAPAIITKAPASLPAPEL